MAEKQVGELPHHIENTDHDQLVIERVVVKGDSAGEEADLDDKCSSEAAPKVKSIQNEVEQRTRQVKNYVDVQVGALRQAEHDDVD